MHFPPILLFDFSRENEGESKKSSKVANLSLRGDRLGLFWFSFIFYARLEAISTPSHLISPYQHLDNPPNKTDLNSFP